MLKICIGTLHVWHWCHLSFYIHHCTMDIILLIERTAKEQTLPFFKISKEPHNPAQSVWGQLSKGEPEFCFWIHFYSIKMQSVYALCKVSASTATTTVWNIVNASHFPICYLIVCTVDEAGASNEKQKIAAGIHVISSQTNSRHVFF